MSEGRNTSTSDLAADLVIARAREGIYNYRTPLTVAKTALFLSSISQVETKLRPLRRELRQHTGKLC